MMMQEDVDNVQLYPDGSVTCNACRMRVGCAKTTPSTARVNIENPECEQPDGNGTVFHVMMVVFPASHGR